MNVVKFLQNHDYFCNYFTCNQFVILKSESRCRDFLLDNGLLMFYYFKTNTAHKKLKSTKSYSFQFKETGCLIHFMSTI